MSVSKNRRRSVRQPDNEITQATRRPITIQLGKSAGATAKEPSPLLQMKFGRLKSPLERNPTASNSEKPSRGSRKTGVSTVT
jgi:hypothetical protein